ncbi:MAG TPA: LysM peptidoglycan-binding domain-containing M23 family metallopeptidase, partial [Anaerolineales bacterium]|nr:LysM peptidoglycan-binding domain-containing M23 family metallopeptidase [Anaerolineales bacterium]
NVTINDLAAANPSLDPNILAPGQQIVIPGLEGVTGILETEIISFGDSLRSLSRRTQVSDEQFKKLNRLVSPTELYVGISLIVPTQEQSESLNTRMTASKGESLLELAVRQGSDPWTLASVNKLDGTWNTLPGDVLYSPIPGVQGNATGLPSGFVRVNVDPLPLKQGHTEVIRAQAKEGVSISGVLVDMPLHFFPINGEQVALQGVHALQEPSVYPLLLEATLPDGSRQSFEQMVLVTSGNYLSEDIQINDPLTLDPAVTEPELQNITAVTAPATPTRYWGGVFTSPAVYTECFTSRYGTRRLYKVINSDIEIEGFHTGLDFCGGEGLQILAPAPGKVVFAAPLSVRGNATIIDHGWGVYSGFWHQSQISVQVGDMVEAGQVIGLVGGTGRVTGAHLHWEVWVNGVQVDPLDWLSQAFP